jgi:hypothetical protein
MFKGCAICLTDISDGISTDGGKNNQLTSQNKKATTEPSTIAVGTRIQEVKLTLKKAYPTFLYIFAILF